MKNIIIIGSGMAAGKLASELSSIKTQTQKITIIGEEECGNYDRIRLASLLKEDNLADFWLNDESWYKKYNIKAILGTRVTGINREKKQVATEKNEVFQYDKLVIATGSNPVIPDIKGIERDSVMTFRNIRDVNRIKEKLKTVNSVIVIGGGVLGLELSSVLKDKGMEVTVSHLMETLMETQLNKEAALYLKKQFENSGINFIMNTYITEISRPDTGGITAFFKTGEKIFTEAVIINCGITPNTELALKSGLKSNKGIVVNERLQTSDPEIYALGECIEYRSKTYGIIAPIYEQARTLAKILTGENIIYPDSIQPPVKLKSGIAAVTMGKINEDNGDEVICYKNPLTNIFKKLIISSNKLKGAHLVGEDLNSDALGIYFTSQLPLPKRIEQILFPGVHKPGSASLAVYWPDSITICDCNGINCGTIRDSIRTYGNDPEKVKKVSKAGTSCGTCSNRIQSIINNTYDAIIIGAGLGGLTAGATLSKNGKRVLLIEKHEKTGGYATSFTREEFEFDVSLHNFGPIYGPFEKILNDLDLLSKINYKPYNNFQKVIFPENELIIPKGMDKFREQLTIEFPSEKSGIKKIMDEIKYIRKGFDEFEELSLEHSQEDAVSPMMAVKYPQFVELVYTTFGELMDKHIKSHKLKGILGCLWWYFGLPPSRVAALLYSVPGAGYFEHGGGYITGTSQKLSNALADIILNNHGKILLNTEVSKVLIHDKKAEAVLTDQGEIFYSDMIISNAGAKNTILNLTEKEQIRKSYFKKVKNQEFSLSAIQLYLGLDCDLLELGFTNHSFTVFYSYDHDENYRFIIDGKYEKTFFSCTNYSQIDKSTSPFGKGIITMFSLDQFSNWKNLTDYEYLKKKETVTKIMIKKLEEYIPGIEKHIIVKELGTPKTMHRYTFNTEGSVYGPSQIIEQSGMLRLKTDTPVKGLYLVGSSIYPGGGYSSTISSGYKTAKMILQKEKKSSS